MPASTKNEALVALFQNGNLTAIWEAFDNQVERIVGYVDGLGTLLHYLVRYNNSLDLFIKLAELGIPLDWQNDRDGDTVLHIACKRGITSIMDYLMQPPPGKKQILLTRANFSLKNKRTEYALDWTAGRYNERVRQYSERMYALATVKDTSNELIKTFIIRNIRLLDVNYRDPTDGKSLLHHYAQKSNLEMVEYLVKGANANPFIKSLGGILPFELTQHLQIRNLLVSTPKPIPSIPCPFVVAIGSGPTRKGKTGKCGERRTGMSTVNPEVEYEGYLEKWTNYASGYKQRWFVLHTGILSYYKNEWEYPEGCRGSVLLRHVRIIRPSGDRCRFTIVNGTSQKIHLRANNEEEAMKWIVFLEEAKARVEESDSNSGGSGQYQTKFPGGIGAKGTTFEFAKLDKGIEAFRRIEVSLLQSERTVETDQCLYDMKEAFTLAKQMQAALEMIRSATLSDEEEEEEEEEEHEIIAGQEEEQQFPESEGEGEEFFDAFSLPSHPESPVQPMGYSADLLRDTLPFRSVDIPKVSLWSFLRGVIGKDLSRLPVPVNYNEPLSMLQRMAEDMQYSNLLSKAATLEHSWQRIQFVTAFAISAYASTENRLSKPFNPLLGETFEFYHQEEGYWYISEQVSHHPPISACYADGPVFTYWNESFVKSHFRGRSLDVVPEGNCHLLLKATGEHYSWRKPRSSVQNILFGKMFIEHTGMMHVINHGTRESCLVEFKNGHSSGRYRRSSSSGRLTSNSSESNSSMGEGRSQGESHEKRLEGQVLNVTGDILDELDGYWNSHLVSKALGPLWINTNDRQEDYYYFSPFTMMLNALNSQLVKFLPPTDSRLRPDQRAFEMGDVQRAQSLKSQLEQKQRDRKKGGIEQRAKWFENVPGAPNINHPTSSETRLHRSTEGSLTTTSSHSHWRYLGGYLESRQEGFTNSFNLFHTDS